MPVLPDFRLETYFSKWEFAARYHLTASDAETLALSELLAMASDESRERWDTLRLGYTETWGMPALRSAIADTYSDVTPDQVLCFAGAEEGIYLAMQTLLEPTDHVIVITPNYQAAETIPLSICDVTGVALQPSDSWALDLDAVVSAIRPNTRMISVNFPNNPTGAVPSEFVWRRLAQICDERGIILFSDEVYQGLGAISLPQAADISARAMSLNVMSKAYGLPGLRIGWIACRDRSMLERLERAKHYTTICNSAPSEILALIALAARDQIIARNRSIIATNIPLFDAFFAQFPELFSWSPPQGGCVCFPQYLGADGVEAMCTELVEQEGVLLLPASIYASSLTETPSDRFRVGLGRKSPEAALDRWATWLEKRS
ncbi:aminotransferase class I/II-fold pyridoxal phosphate-dependent enzyme [Kibdelosporangium philippinense]|uniref:Aminotransferase class I/II-fold pyridoxal phosphate-dependent enzyme n=1 Tax=Kibdelosporangium philippinense TaxID=211113 RepID=A0ABS8Z8F1_9PSEU|nr:aminotransferase class I/II-fold pyridoxal phosphate-dependent enzyme [Kibdelosporangium philippinense]MCE7002838.1 aminotransferase class I/II-fold pyridoxal phosphate-dependent enzyme [Kibdelosporangium philippinense]